MKTRLIGTLALTAALATLSSAALAHGPQGSHGGMHGQGHGPMMGPGMMGYGHGPMMGPGMMGYGHGPMMGHHCMMGDGMMGPGMMCPGMMGPGMMGRDEAPMMGRGGFWPLPQDLTVDQVRHMMGHHVEMSGNPNLKVGEVTEKDENTILADVVTQDGSLVRRFAFDRHTGAFRPADQEQREQ